MPAALKPPVAASAPALARQTTPSCVVEEEADGTLTVTFTVSAPAARIMKRQSEGRDLSQWLWDTWGLRHLENQRVI